MDIKRMHCMIEKLTECAEQELAKGVECVDTAEMGAVIDMIKDISEAMYHRTLQKTMEESDTEDIMDMFDRYGDGGRMYYDRYRYSNGRFAPKGRGTRMGYNRPYLYMQGDDWMEEYLHNREFERNVYRMGYHPDRSDMRMDGMNHKQSRYGETYDRYSENRRHYHDSNDTESKRKMDDSMKEYTSDIIRNLTEMWSDADATLRQSMKTDLTRLIQQMN